MAGASMKDIKLRIRSVEGTMQITKAMELVASSKLRRAKARQERCRPYYTQLKRTLDSIEATALDFSSPFQSGRPLKSGASLSSRATEGWPAATTAMS